MFNQVTSFRWWWFIATHMTTSHQDMRGFRDASGNETSGQACQTLRAAMCCSSLTSVRCIDATANTTTHTPTTTETHKPIFGDGGQRPGPYGTEPDNFHACVCMRCLNLLPVACITWLEHWLLRLVLSRNLMLRDRLNHWDHSFIQ